MEVNEIRTRSIRADNESFEKFKVIADEFPNQAQALSSLISVYEIEKSKAILTDRQTEIESFTAYVQKINELYNHSLLLNHDAEIRIRQEFIKQLTSREETIQDLQLKIKSIEITEKSASSENIKLQEESKQNKGEIKELENEIKILGEEKIKSDNVIKSLTEIMTEYKGQSKENEKIKISMSNLEKENVELKHQKEKLEERVKENAVEIEKMREEQKKTLEKAEKENEKTIKFMIERLELEKGQEKLELNEKYNDKINKIHEDNQKRVEELLKQIIKDKPDVIETPKKRTSDKTAKEKNKQVEL